MPHVKRSEGGRARHPLKPWRQPQKAREAQDNEKRSPSKMSYQGCTQENSKRGSQRLTRSDNGIGDAALALPKMVSENFRVRRVCDRLSDSQNHAYGQ